MRKPLSNIASNVKASTTIAIDTLFKQMKADGKDVIGFGAGEPDFNTPQYIKDAAIKAVLDNQTRYTPAAGNLNLRQAICDNYKRDYGLSYEPSQVVVSSGAKHTLSQCLQVLCNPGDEVIIPAPFWVSYPEMVAMAGATPVIVEPKDGFDFTIEDFKKTITQKTKAVIINSPSNPTGMIYSPNVLRGICEICVNEGIYIISDEIYDKLIYDDNKFTPIASLSPEVKDITLTVNGVSKTYAMTGWRIGWVCANKEIAKILSAYQSHAASGPCSISQVAAYESLLGTSEETEHMRKEFEIRRDFFMEKVAQIPEVSCVKPQGAFYVMLNVSGLFGKKLFGETIDSADTFAKVFLEKKGVAVVPCEGFGAPEYIRMSYATSKENIDKGLSRLKEFVREI